MLLCLSSILCSRQKIQGYLILSIPFFGKRQVLNLMCNANFNAVGLKVAMRRTRASAWALPPLSTQMLLWALWHVAGISLSVCSQAGGTSWCKRAADRDNLGAQKKSGNCSRKVWCLNLMGFPFRAGRKTPYPFMHAACLAIWPAVCFHSVRLKSISSNLPSQNCLGCLQRDTFFQTVSSFSDRISFPFLCIFYLLITYVCGVQGNEMMLSVSLVLSLTK